MLAFAKVPDPERFGVPVFNEQGELIDVVEKPINPPNNFAQTGIYLYGPKLFFRAFDKIEKSGRGEYEISSIHSYLLKTKQKVSYQEITGWWKDTGKPDDLVIASALLLDEMRADSFKREGAISSEAKLRGNVHIGLGTTIGGGVVINGPVIIGENCTLENCFIGPHTTIGAGCSIRNATISDCIILGNSAIDCPLKITNSIVGERVTLKKNGENGVHRMIIGDHAWIEV